VEVADEACILKTSFQQISTENLGLQRVVAQFVPRLLSEEQTQQRLDVSHELLDRQNTPL
jgi:hypothetical protein